MKQLIIAAALAAALAAGAETKVGTVDLMLLVRNHPDYERNKTFLSDKDKDGQKKLDEIKKEGEELQDEGKKLAEQFHNPILAEKAKAESFEKLKSTVRESMERARVEGEKRRREDEAVELLLKKVDFDVPQTQVDSVMQGMLSEMAQRAQLSGLDASYFEQNAEKIRKDAAENAERHVRLWYVIEAIAKAENIEADDKEIGPKVVEFVLANAKK